MESERPPSECPCGSAQGYSQCCGPLIRGERCADTALQLMRSRYVAFAQRETGFLLETSHPSLREHQSASDLRESARGVEWCGLQVLDVQAGSADDDEGSVRFVASCREKGRALEHHELAHFVRCDGRWFYERGDVKVRVVPTRSASKVGRNAPCPCGSGVKFKRCCGQ